MGKRKTKEDLISDNNKTTDSNDIETPLISSKEKKKKRKIDPELCPHDDSLETTEFISDSRDKKKKKKKSKEIDSDFQIQTDSGKDDDSKIKKEKKKKRKNSEGIVESVEVENGKADEIIDSGKSKKKKKDKNKCKDSESCDEKLDTEHTVVSSEERLQKKKKKKEKSVEENVESTLGVVDTNILQQAVTNLGMPLQEEVNASKPAEENKKKKKKKKDKEKMQVKTATTAIETSVEGEQSKADKALKYLGQWHKDRSNWHFSKLLQVKLLHMMFNTQQMPDEDFSVMLLYLEGLKGKSREQTKEEAHKLLSDAETDTTDNVVPGQEDRARQVFQLLS